MLILHLTFAQGHSLGLVVLNPKTSPLTWQLNMVLSDEITAERGSSIWPTHCSPVHHGTKDESQKRLRKSPLMISLTCKKLQPSSTHAQRVSEEKRVRAVKKSSNASLKENVLAIALNPLYLINSPLWLTGTPVNDPTLPLMHSKH